MENIEEINKLTDLLRRSYQALIYKELNTNELRKEISDNIYTLSVFKHQDAPKLAMKKTGIEFISNERKRQVDVEGWDSDHDSKHIDGELAKAAMVYCNPDPSADFIARNWPFLMRWYKPASDINNIKERIVELSKAGALIAAEIDRLQIQSK